MIDIHAASGVGISKVPVVSHDATVAVRTASAIETAAELVAGIAEVCHGIGIWVRGWRVTHITFGWHPAKKPGDFLPDQGHFYTAIQTGG